MEKDEATIEDVFGEMDAALSDITFMGLRGFKYIRTDLYERIRENYLGPRELESDPMEQLYLFGEATTPQEMRGD